MRRCGFPRRPETSRREPQRLAPRIQSRRRAVGEP
nr:MAG TPA: hypothetical protein [Caudoviricetes sp.]